MRIKVCVIKTIFNLIQKECIAYHISIRINLVTQFVLQFFFTTHLNCKLPVIEDKSGVSSGI